MIFFSFIFWIGISFLFILFAFLSFPISFLPDRGRTTFYLMAQKALKVLFRCNCVSAKIKGMELLPKDKSLLFISSRPRKFMYFYLIAYFPLIFRIVADEQLCRLPFIGRVFTTIGSIPFPGRESGKKETWVFGGRLYSALKAKQNVLFFYENLRGVRPERVERREKVVEITRQSGAEIIPIVVTSRGIQRSKHIFANEQLDFEIKKHITVGEADETSEVINKIESIFESRSKF